MKDARSAKPGTWSLRAYTAEIFFMPLCTVSAALVNFPLDEPRSKVKSENTPLQECAERYCPGLSFVLVSVCGCCFLGSPSREHTWQFRSVPIGLAGLLVVPVRLSLFSDEILKSVQPSPSRAATL
jgi:hypothetical protein